MEKQNLKNEDNKSSYYERNKEKFKLYYKENKERIKLYYEENKYKISENRKEYYKNNKETFLENQKLYYNNNREEIIKRNKEYYEENKDEVLKNKAIYYNKNREKYIEYSIKNQYNYTKKRKDNDPVYRLQYNIKGNLRKNIRGIGYGKNSYLNDVLGCNYAFFKQYIESKFEPWMNWDNYGKYNGTYNFGWDIDHIIPISTAKTEEEVIKLNYYTNLRPLCSYINRTKYRD